MFAIRDERDYVVQEDFMKVGGYTHDCLRCRGVARNSNTAGVLLPMSMKSRSHLQGGVGSWGGWEGCKGWQVKAGRGGAARAE